MRRKSTNPKAKGREKQMDKSSEERTSRYKGRTESKFNDPSWYTRNSLLASNSGRISFNYPTGAGFDLVGSDSGFKYVNGVPGEEYSLPGICSLHWAPCYGNPKSATDPINVSALNIFNDIRVNNAGSYNYTQTDLMLYLMAMDNIYSLYQTGVRMFGIMSLTSPLNRYLPHGLAHALCMDYKDFQSNLANFQYYLNQVAAKIKAMAVPAKFTLFTRHMWMNSGVYQDAPTQKSQFYVFHQMAYGMYNEKGSSMGGYLSQQFPVSLSNPWTYSSYTQFMDAMLASVLESEDCARISADILKRYGDSGLFSVFQIAPDYAVLPTYDTTVLRQIQNATILGGAVYYDHINNDLSLDQAVLWQDPDRDILLGSFRADVSSKFYLANRILTGSDSVPDEGEVLENSRLMVTGEIVDSWQPKSIVSQTPTYTFVPREVGSEVISQCFVYGMDNYRVYTHSNTPIEAEGLEYALSMLYYDRDNPSDWALSPFMFSQTEGIISGFNYHPAIGTDFKTDSMDLDPTGHVQCFDVDNFAIITREELWRMHNTALLSMFDIVG